MMDVDGGGVAVESLTDQREPSHPQAAVAGAVSSTSPRLVLLPLCSELTDDFSVVAGADVTSTVSCTSTGRRFRVSLGFVPSPEISSFCSGWEDPDPRVDDGRFTSPMVIAAHRDCVLFEVTTPSTSMYCAIDYFLYQAMATGRPLSMSQLPPCNIPTMEGRMLHGLTGVLQRGEDDIVVAKLKTPEKEEAELGLLRLSGNSPEWQLKRVPIIVYDAGKGSSDDERQHYDDPLRWWCTDAAFAVGNRFLCWVDFLRGFLFADMTEDELSLRLRYAPLPIEPPSGNPCATEFGRSNLQCTRNLASAGDGSVRFIDVESRCCCGDRGSSTSCERGWFLFTVTTWSLNVSMDEPMEWVKDGVLDCDELWAQPGYTGLPRVTVGYPIVVNSDDPDAVCFVVCTDYHCYSMDRVDRKIWRIEVDTRRKLLHSVVPDNGSGDDHPRCNIFPATIEY